MFLCLNERRFGGGGGQNRGVWEIGGFSFSLFWVRFSGRFLKDSKGVLSTFLFLLACDACGPMGSCLLYSLEEIQFFSKRWDPRSCRT